MKRRLIAFTLAVIAVLAPAGCGGDRSSPGGGDSADIGSDPLGGPVQTPPCPFTAEQMSAFLHLTMSKEGECGFRADNSYSLATITPADKTTALVTYAGARDRAGKTYATVKDIDRGEKGYVAYKDIEGELFVIGSPASYLIHLSGIPQFEKDPAGYEPLLLRMFDAIKS